MLMVDAPAIRQRLFVSRTGDGRTFCLAFLAAGGCAILRDDEVIQAWDNDIQALDLALDRFMELTRDAHGDLPADQANQSSPSRSARH